MVTRIPDCPTCVPASEAVYHDDFAGHTWYRCLTCGLVFRRFTYRAIKTLDKVAVREKGL